MGRLFSAAIFFATALGVLSAAEEPIDQGMVARIKQEGLQHSRAQARGVYRRARREARTGECRRRRSRKPAGTAAAAIRHTP